VTVALDGDEVIGFGGLSPFHKRSGYRFSVENTVYVHPDRHRRGVGRALLADLLVRARAAGFRSVIASISGDQTPSIALHTRFGFEIVARMRAVGFKFDRWLDLVYMQHQIVSA
jgi:L-amino acid N-acyltransferase